MPQIDLVDSTWIGAPAIEVAAVIADARNWPRWWPWLELEAAETRGAKGVRWTVRSAERRRMTGTMEIWLEPDPNGVVAHYFLRLDRRDHRRVSRARRERIVRRHRARAKQVMWAVSDVVDPGRMARIAAPRDR